MRERLRPRRARDYLLQRKPRFFQLSEPLVGVGHVDEHRRHSWSRDSGALKRGCGIVPSSFAKGDQSKIERSGCIACTELYYAPELPGRIAVHSRPVEGDTKIAMLRDHAVLDHAVLGLAHSYLHEECSGHQPEDCLADVELAHLGDTHQLMYVAEAVDQREEPLLLFSESNAVAQKLLPVQGEYDFETRQLLFDQRPFVDAPRPLEEESLRIHRHEICVRRGRNTRLEAERSVGPLEHHEHGIFRAQVPSRDGCMTDTAVVE